jgi:hypothetical protein
MSAQNNFQSTQKCELFFLKTIHFPRGGNIIKLVINVKYPVRLFFFWKALGTLFRIRFGDTKVAHQPAKAKNGPGIGAALSALKCRILFIFIL